MSDYQHDIFLSYRRLGNATDWIKDHLIPVLKSALAQELGRDPEIYFDNQLEGAMTWPVTLGSHLARSRVLVCLWSKTYLKSQWCSKELALIWEREKKLQLRTPQHPHGITAVYTIHDGETIPETLKICQTLAITEFFNPMMRLDSPTREGFFNLICQHADTLATMIQNAPAFDETWETNCTEAFFDQFYDALPADANPSPPRYTR